MKYHYDESMKSITTANRVNICYLNYSLYGLFHTNNINLRPICINLNNSIGDYK